MRILYGMREKKCHNSMEFHSGRMESMFSISSKCLSIPICVCIHVWILEYVIKARTPCNIGRSPEAYKQTYSSTCRIKYRPTSAYLMYQVWSAGKLLPLSYSRRKKKVNRTTGTTNGTTVVLLFRYL